MKVIKRNGGKKVDFRKEKIVNAIANAMNETEAGVDLVIAMEIAKEIKRQLKEAGKAFDVELIQDKVEELLAKSGRFDASKRYVLYRSEQQKKREQGWDMNDLQRDIYEKKYRFEGETFSEFLDRVSGGNSEVRKLMRDQKFLPAGRILAGRGLNERGRKVVYSNCFVLDSPKDNIESIFDTAKKMARTYSMGGGVGIDISKLRPIGSTVNNAAQTTSGAVSFMDLYSMTTGLIGQRGRRKQYI